jgi:hydrogenase maturation protease
MTRVLIGGVGYRNLRDHSFGVVLVDSLARDEWPAGVSVEDLSYNPVAVVQRLQDEPKDDGFCLAILIGAMQRSGRAPGTLSVYRWDNVLPGADDIHDAITEAVTGIISLDNTLVVARHFNALPPTVVVVELEPDAHEHGDSLTPAVAATLGRARDLVTLLARAPATAEQIPEGSLANERVRHTGVVFGQVIYGPARIH